jgi:pilus assembly protein Flp/PilA
MPTLRAWEEIMADRIKMFLADESGATAIEYALIAGLIALAIIASVTGVGVKIGNTLSEVSSNLK